MFFFPSPVWFACKFTSTVIGFDLGLLFLRFLFFETDQVVTWLSYQVQCGAVKSSTTA